MEKKVSNPYGIGLMTIPRKTRGNFPTFMYHGLTGWVPPPDPKMSQVSQARS